MKRTGIIIGLALTLIVVLLFGIQFFYWSPNWNKIINRCVDYNPQWLGMLDCYGVISIWQPDNSGYLIQNNKEPGPIIAEINGANDFIIQGNEMYFIDITPIGGCAVAERGKYCRDFQVNGESKVFGYSSPDQVPTYVVIDTSTGDERFYDKVGNVPANERSIFQELLNKK